MDSLDTLLDRQAITDLIYDYARHVDDSRPDDVAALFTEDCMFRSTAGGNGTAHGRAAVRDRMQVLLSTFAATSHHVTNIQITFTGPDTAEGLAYLFAWHDFTADRPVGYLWGRYADVFHRTSEGWRFAERSMHVTGHQDFPFKWLAPYVSDAR